MKNVCAKIEDYLSKSALRYQSIKYFNAKERTQEEKSEDSNRRSTNPDDHVSSADEGQGSKSLLSKRKMTSSKIAFNEIIMEHQKDKRLAIKEMVDGYPEIKRIINLELEEPPLFSAHQARRELVFNSEKMSLDRSGQYTGKHSPEGESPRSKKFDLFVNKKKSTRHEGEKLKLTTQKIQHALKGFGPGLNLASNDEMSQAQIMYNTTINLQQQSPNQASNRSNHNQTKFKERQSYESSSITRAYRLEKLKQEQKYCIGKSVPSKTALNQTMHESHSQIAINHRPSTGADSMKKDAEQLTQKINEIRELQFNKGHQIPLSS